MDEEHQAHWDYVAGDASQAYGPDVTQALRKVLFIRPGIIVLFDELAAKSPASFQFMLHGLSPFTVNEAGQTLSLQQPNAGLKVHYLGREPLAFKQRDGFDVRD